MERPITERQRQTLQLIADGRTTRDILHALGLSPGSTQAVYDTIRYLMMKGALRYRRGTRPGQVRRYQVTERGWAELGRKICPTCNGQGTLHRFAAPPTPPRNSRP